MDFSHLNQDFPVLQNTNVVYLDSTATSLKPYSVIKKEAEYYEQYTSNVHRGIYRFAEKATAEYEETRKVVAQFLSALPEEVIFTRGTTESINLIASTIGDSLIESKDRIVGTLMDHHSNFVPWQQLAAKKGAEWNVVEFTDDAFLDTDSLTSIITPNTKLFAFCAVSNTFGTINPVAAIIKRVREIQPEIIIVVDAAQAAPHTGIHVQDWDADFIAFSAHKMLGPSGVGILWGKKKHLDTMPPYQFGGEMVLNVTVDRTDFKDTPHKFEAGTPHIAGVIAFKEALLYLKNIGFENILKHEQQLRQYAVTQLKEAFGDQITIFGETHPKERCGILSFTFGKYHAHDIAHILDESNIAVRAGHHCTMPLHKKLGVLATARASFYLYNTEQDVDSLVEGLKKVAQILKI